MNWTTFENSVHGAVKAALRAAVSPVTAVPNDRLLWAHQSNDRTDLGPTSVYPTFVTLTHLGSEFLGTDHHRDVIDNPTPTAGNEILIRTLGQLEVSIRVNVFASGSTGTLSAGSVASNVRNTLDRVTSIDLLEEVGIAFVAATPVTTLPTVLETKFESRAFFDLTFRVCDLDQESNTYIETVEFTGTYT